MSLLKSICFFVALGIYRLGWCLAIPGVILRLLLKGSKSEQEYNSWPYIVERFGFYPIFKKKQNNDSKPGLLICKYSKTIWIHAVSVGETRAVVPLLELILDNNQDCQIVLTHMTIGGRKVGEALAKQYQPRLITCYVPYDMSFAVHRFLNFFKPSVCLLMETEIWPMLTLVLKKIKIPLVLINARLSEKSLKKAQRYGYLSKTIFGNLDMVMAQNQSDAKRFEMIGAKQIIVNGNLKFDNFPAPEMFELGKQWRDGFQGRPTWVAISTRAGEENILLNVHKKLLEQFPQALLIIVPRHATRCDEVLRLAQTHFEVARRSAIHFHPKENSTWHLPSNINIWLGDSMGEVVAYCAASDIAFVGGSLVPTGGQNLIECCSAKIPVVFGPSMYNFSQASADALAKGAACQIKNSDELLGCLTELFLNSYKQSQMAAAAYEFRMAHTGASRLTYQALQQQLQQQLSLSALNK